MNIRVTRNLEGRRLAPSVITIGNFDGVHRGHQAILAELARLSLEHGVPARLLTFEPHPVEFLTPDQAPPRLTRFREKLARLARMGLSQVTCAAFDERLSRCTPRAFIDDMLVERLRVRHVLVGDDFRFGHRGAGDYALLAASGERLGFGVSKIPTVLEQGARISSTRVRDLLCTGELNAARELLGHAYAVCGRVRQGQQLGRTIGFPTANIAAARNRFALNGVFAVSTLDAGGQRRNGVANVGRRPTVDGLEERLEVHLFDFDGDLYGQELHVEFVERIRGERKFPNLDALKAQIDRDATAARACFDGAAP